MASYKFTKSNHIKRFITMLSVITLTISGVFSIYSSNSANAAVTGWMAGRIIDDSVFTNKSSMSASQIQTFLNNQIPSCDTNGTQPAYDFDRPDLTHAQYAASRGWQAPPYTCLRNYNKDGKTAAQLIYDTAQKHSISPKVLLVLLQKEQGLVTDTWPLNIPQYRAATGYGCPDTAACDSKYYWLPNQLDLAGKMFRSIMDNSPDWYTPYKIGNNYIQYNPTKSCGGSNVYIQNRATQALYNYTPYQPNAATLAANWGQTVDCGAYGNKDFYLYFTKWFGATTSAATYSYSVVAKEMYSDYTYETKITGTPTIAPNQEVYAKITVKNTGNQAWYSDNLKIGTANTRDRVSEFATFGGNGSWLCTRRPAYITENSVSGGENATFTFAMKAPLHLGKYQESFGIVIEGYRWLGGDFNIPINVTTVDPYYNARTISFSAYSDSQMTNKLDLSKITVYTNSKIYVKAMIKNTGNQILPANITKIATTNPRDRSSTYSDDSWPSRNRTALANSDIQPQNTATFNFSITAPDTPTKRTQEQFGFVIEGQRWLNDNIGSLSIQTIQKPPSVLTTSQSLIKGEGILSGNKKYRLILQGDGNLVLYSPTKAIWSSRTVGSSTTKLIMQSDGNLVLYRANSTSTWSSKTNGRGASNLIIQTDGNLVIYDSSRRATWATYTNN